MITPRGAVLVIVAIGLFVLAGSTRVGWLLLFDAVLWGILILSTVMPWVALGRMRIRRRIVGWTGRPDDANPMEGSPVQFELFVQNRGLLPCIFVSVAYNLAGRVTGADRERLFLAWLGPGQTATATARAIFDRRGRHSLPEVSVETSAPFGLFRRSKRVGTATELLVLPRVYPVGSLESLGASGSAEPRSASARVGEQTAGSRNYLPGDPWAHIHWRNTGRTAQPQVKEFERTPDRSLAIVFSSRDLAKRGNTEATEHAVRIAASLADAVCRAGGTVRLLADGLDTETADRHTILTELALFDAVSDAGMAELLAKCPPSSDLVAVLPDTLVGQLESLTNGTRYQRRITAIVLRGFRADGRPVDIGTPDGVTLIECWPDRIPEALAELSGQGSVSGRQTPPVGVGHARE